VSFLSLTFLRPDILTEFKSICRRRSSTPLLCCSSQDSFCSLASHSFSFLYSIERD
ncbi:hypothetical protein CSUI_007900, partial [Cystoisospora suis]